jgi:hypothetical protein
MNVASVTVRAITQGLITGFVIVPRRGSAGEEATAVAKRDLGAENKRPIGLVFHLIQRKSDRCVFFAVCFSARYPP